MKQNRIILLENSHRRANMQVFLIYVCYLNLRVFSNCTEDIDVELLVKNCKYDYCVAHNNATVCSPLERLADHCKKKGSCVTWRNLSKGICGKVDVLPACVGHMQRFPMSY